MQSKKGHRGDDVTLRLGGEAAKVTDLLI